MTDADHRGDGHGDTLVRGRPRPFIVKLSLPANATIADGTGVGTITNDDAPTVLSISDVSVAEGNSGTTSLVFTVTLSAASGQSVTVNYATADGTATARQRLHRGQRDADLHAGPDDQDRYGPGPGRHQRRGERDVHASTSRRRPTPPSPRAQAPAPSSTTTCRRCRSATSPSPKATAARKSATFTVTLSAPAQTVTVDYATANGTATAGSDFAHAGTATLRRPASTSTDRHRHRHRRYLVEANETFTVNLQRRHQRRRIGTPSGHGTIINDDTAPTMTIIDVTVAEGNAGSPAATFTVTLSTASGCRRRSTTPTADGTATAGSDYTATAEHA